ncbi:MAG TPA: bifunctional nuclease family protein [Elusimicrobiales bacterium]|nr:bifunctional nuclease family protein [Elusimicrobiales bacterium]
MKKENTAEKNVEVRIYSIATSMTESIIFLDETEGTRILPIWIGPMEAQAIAIRLSGYPSPRPMTHDLLFSVIKTLGLKITSVTITDIVENTYYSNLRITDADGENPRLVDARPSDAVAMAVRFGCPIYISERVFGKTQVLSKPITEDEVVKFKHDLKNLKPNDIIGQLLDGKLKPSKEKDRRERDEEETQEQEGEQDDE